METTPESEWQRVIDADMGDVLWEYHDEAADVHGYVIRGPGALCGYVGTNQAHALWVHAVSQREDNSWRNNDYDFFDWIPVHGGMTYCGPLSGTKAYDPKYNYVGWDYAHAGDAVWFKEAKSGGGYGHQWTVPEVAKHVRRVARIFTNYKTLIENMEAGLCDQNAVELFKRLEGLE